MILEVSFNMLWGSSHVIIGICDTLSTQYVPTAGAGILALII